jgi:hypothetical protein
MASDGFEERKRLTFEQAEGVEPLPRQLKLKEISPQLRAALWRVVHDSLNSSRRYVEYSKSRIGEPWSDILRDMHTFREHLMVDDFSELFDTAVHKAKGVFERGDYVAIFGWLQWVLRRRDCPSDLSKRIDAALQFSHAAYRVLENRTIVPIGSDAELETIKRAFADLATTEFRGARKHLHTAAEELTAGKYSDSIRESIHAVESVVRVLEPKGDFAKALAKLDAKARIHGAMKAGFGSLYGFTSDEKGIRHPLLEKGAAEVDETDALFMIGACAAFVSYLINKARAAGLLVNNSTGR